MKRANIYSECEISNTTSLSLLYKETTERERQNERNETERRQRHYSYEHSRVFTKICMMIICVYVCVCVSQNGEKFDFQFAPFLGENAPARDIIASRVRWDRERVSLSSRSKKTKSECFFWRSFLSHSKKDDDIERRSERCKSTHRERNWNEFEEYQAERVHAERRLETPETIERGFEKHEQRNSDHSQRNNRRDSVFGGTI